MEHRRRDTAAGDFVWGDSDECLLIRSQQKHNCKIVERVRSTFRYLNGYELENKM